MWSRGARDRRSNARKKVCKSLPSSVAQATDPPEHAFEIISLDVNISRDGRSALVPNCLLGYPYSVYYSGNNQLICVTDSLKSKTLSRLSHRRTTGLDKGFVLHLFSL